MIFRAIGITLICMCLILGLTSQGTAEIDLKNLTGLWMFDEGKGDESEDLSGNENHAEFIDGPEWIDGVFGKALQFDGVASHVKIPDHANPTEAITVTAWVKSEGATWNQHGWVLEKRDAFMLHNIQGSTNMGWIVVNGGLWNLPFDWQAGAVGPDDITEWHMYTGTFDSATGEWYLYIDGNLESELDLNADALAEDFGPIFIGNDSVEAGRFGAGAVDEIAIFDVALSEEDIQTIFNDGFEMVLAVEPGNSVISTWGAVKASH